MRRRTRTVIIAALGVVLLLAGAVLALPRVIDVDRYRGRVEAELEERLARPVSLGRMHLSLAPLGIRVENAVIGADPRFDTGRPFAQAEEIYVSARFWPLLRGRFELSSVELQQPMIELVRDREGVWNVATLGRERTDGDEEREVVLDELIVRQGRIAVTDLQSREGRALYENIDARVEGYARDRPFAVDVSATLPGEGTQRIALRGRAGPVVAGQMAMTPFDGSVQLEEVSISGLQRFVNVAWLEDAESFISGSADLKNEAGTVSSSGSLQLDRTRVRGTNVGYPMALDYAVAHELDTQVLTVTRGQLRLAQARLSASGTVDLESSPPVLSMHVTTSNASLAEAARLASAFGVVADTDVRGTVSADVRARGPADRPALQGRVRVRDLRISGERIPRPVSTESVELTLSPSEIRSDRFAISSGGTSLDAQLALQQYTSEQPRIEANLRTTNAELTEVLNAARAWGIDAAEQVQGRGRLTLDVRARGPLEDPTYSGSGRLSAATLSLPSITRPLNVSNASLRFSEAGMTLDELAASIGGMRAQGTLTMRNFEAPDVRFDLSVNRIDAAEVQALVAPARPSADRPADRESILRRTTGAGSVRVGSIVYEELVLDDVRSNVALDRGVVRFDPLTADLFGGRQQGSIVVDSRATPSIVNVSGRLSGVDADRLLSATTSLDDVISGRANARVRASFAMGRGVQGIAPTLDGALTFELLDGRIATMDLLGEVGTIAQFVTGRAGAEGSTRVRQLRGSFDVTRGVARTDDLTAVIDGGSLAAAGSIDLASQALDMRLTVVLSSELTERVGGNRIGGLMTTALANEEGELVVPVRLRGTLRDPSFMPDARRFAEMQARQLVPDLDDPGALGSRILGALVAPGEEERSVEERLGDVLGALTGTEEREPQARAEREVEPEAQDEPSDPAGRIADALRGLQPR